MEQRYIRQIIGSFPYPISVNYKRLRSRDCSTPGAERLRHLLATAESTARFLAFVVLAECRESLEKKPAPPPRFDRELAKILKSPVFGVWINVIRTGLKWLKDNPEDMVCVELLDFYFATKKQTAAASALDEMVRLRNDLSHDKIKAFTAKDYQQLCENLETALETLLKALAFLSDYELRFVDRIEVSRRRRQLPHFTHHFELACGSDDVFEADTLTGVRDCLESEVMIFKNLDNQKYLNLDPFYVYEKNAQAPDIFSTTALKSWEFTNTAPAKRGRVLFPASVSAKA